MTDRILQGLCGDGSKLFAGVDAASRYVSPQVCTFKFTACLAPYRSEEAARDALTAAGAEKIEEVGR
jgi:hypothetical protein